MDGVRLFLVELLKINCNNMYHNLAVMLLTRATLFFVFNEKLHLMMMMTMMNA